MKKYKNHINIFLGISALVVIGGFSYLFNNFWKQSKLQIEILQVGKNLAQADSLADNLLQIESDIRAFQHTNDSAYLEKLYLLKISSNRHIENLKKNYITEKDGRATLEIDSLMKWRIANLDSGIHIFKSRELDAAVAFMQLNDKKNARELFFEKLDLYKGQLLERLNSNATSLIGRNSNNKESLIVNFILFIAGMFIAAYFFKKAQKKVIRNHIRFQEAQRIAKIGSW